MKVTGCLSIIVCVCVCVCLSLALSVCSETEDIFFYCEGSYIFTFSNLPKELTPRKNLPPAKKNMFLFSLYPSLNCQFTM